MKKLYLSLQLFGISMMAVAQSSPLVHVTIDPPAAVCSLGDCTVLHTEYLSPGNTSDYDITSIQYNPSFPFFGGTTLNANADDVWSPSITLPFTFRFYGNTYNSLLVGSNGLVTFDQTNNAPSGNCLWNFNQTIPNAAFPIRNAIYGVYQDSNIASPPVTNASIQNVNYYVLDTGVNAAPNRVFVINFNELPQYQCNNSVGMQTSQIVMYETTNIIDVYVKNRTSCTSWNSGSGLIGIQNQAGSAAVVPPGRNTGTWTATNEAWRFSPMGNEFLPTTFAWYLNGVMLDNEYSDSLNICPTNTNDSYSVSMYLLNPDFSQTIVSSNIVTGLLAPDPGLTLPLNLSVCTESTAVYVVDLEVNTSYMLSTTDEPSYYLVEYYENLTDAQIHNNNDIANADSYEFTEDKTIYARIENLNTGCVYFKPFQISITPTVAPPSGLPNQNFTAGQTLANLVLDGQNLTWYPTATSDNALPSSTLLQDGVTYWATQIVNGCESNRNTNATRFAVTTHLVLSNEAFNNNVFSVYPNPVGDRFTITAKDDLKSISIYNAIGQEILHTNPDQKELLINTSTLGAGVYFLKMNTAMQTQTIKIIKN